MSIWVSEVWAIAEKLSTPRRSAKPCTIITLYFRNRRRNLAVPGNWYIPKGTPVWVLFCGKELACAIAYEAGQSPQVLADWRKELDEKYGVDLSARQLDLKGDSKPPSCIQSPLVRSQATSNGSTRKSQWCYHK